MSLIQFRKLTLVFLIVFTFLSVSVQAKDEWIQVRSKNFNLIGNASEKNIRRVATKLEQFRETFRQLFSRANLNSPIPTNVIVFKNDGAYKPFKPKRADGKIDNFIAGYFQPGEDVNYITLSTAGDNAETFGTIFHEYVHFIIETNFGKSEIPPWFNEGLAEYYQTFEIENDQKVKLGLPQSGHLQLLKQSKLIPLDTLFSVSNYSLHQNAAHSRSIFYAQSWALIHNLIQGGKSVGLGKFINLLFDGVAPEKAFQDAFEMNYEQMEKELKRYVGQHSYKYAMITFENKLLFDADMITTPISEAQSNAFLGDLLYRINRADDAEEYLQNALTLQPDLSMANTSLGMVKIKQRKFDDAKIFLEKAISQDQKNHLAFYKYAYLISREGRDEFGFVSSFPEEKSAKMRQLLEKAIEINPGYTESYELFAFISLVNNEELDKAVTYLQKALKYQPGNQKYSLRIAEINLRQEKFDEALAIANKIAKSSDDQEVKSRAENLVGQIGKIQENFAQRQIAKKKFEEAIANANKNGERPVIIQRSKNGKDLTPEEIAKIEAEAVIRSMNEALKKPAEGEKQILAKIQKIQCKGNAVTYTIKADKETLLLSSVGFQNLTLVTFVSEPVNTEVGCGVDLSKINTVLTYKTRTPGKDGVVGELEAIDFVPENFRIMDESELVAQVVVVTDRRPPMPPPPVADLEARKREAMLTAIKNAMRKPEPGEKREIGKIEKIECNNKGQFFYLKTETATYKLTAKLPQTLLIRAFTPEVEQVQFGCGLKNLDVPVVFAYKEDLKGKDKSNGELVSLEFVPKSFTLEQ